MVFYKVYVSLVVARGGKNAEDVENWVFDDVDCKLEYLEDYVITRVAASPVIQSKGDDDE